MKRLFVAAVAIAIILALPGTASGAVGQTVTLNIGAPYIYFDAAGQTHVDGFGISNPDSTYPVTDLVATITWHDAAHNTLRIDAVPLDNHVLMPGAVAAGQYSGIVPLRPTAATHHHVVATGVATDPSVTRETSNISGGVVKTTSPLDGHREFSGNLTNPKTYPVTAAIVHGYELHGPAPTPSFLLDAFHDTGGIATVLPASPSPGSVPFALEGIATIPLGEITAEGVGADFVRYTPQPVYRFFNKRNGTHFYTADETEKSNVLATLSGIYQLEFVAYQINTTSPSNMRPLYRFFNKRNGTHFYTAVEAEKNNVIATLSDIYDFEGAVYYVSSFPYYSRPMYRFYNPSTGAHFYTIDEAEKNNVIANLSKVFKYEGVAFYLAY